MSQRTVRSQDRSLRGSLITFSGAFVVLLMFPSGARLLAQKPADDSEMRNRALLLWERNNFAEALPLLEKLAAAHPTDIVVLERLGGALGGSALLVTEPEARKKLALRARSVLLKAKELGDNSNYLQVMLEKIPENGEISPFSTRKEVDEAIRDGEAAFRKSDYAGSIAAYQRALELDPQNYLAALFTGDVYFNMNQMDKAATWFAKAIEIDPDQETAYRYWGDALLKEGKMLEAREKFIDAVIAQPYQVTTWGALEKWAKGNQITISHPKIESPVSVAAEGNQISINLPEASGKKDDPTPYWLAYGMTRALWQGEQFKKEFPNEKTYRHSLREEVQSLDAVAEMAAEDAKDARKRKHMDPNLLKLVELRDQGLLESYVLLSRADKGIAQDYAAYRAAHRDKLRRYITDWLLTATAPAK